MCAWGMLWTAVRTQLSFLVARSVPSSPADQLALLSTPYTSVRLRALIPILERFSVLRCARCTMRVGSVKHVFTATKQGAMGVFVNPAGFLHQTITLDAIANRAIIYDPSPPSTESSWFQGYAWTIMYCRCGNHLGWRCVVPGVGRS